MKSLLSQRMVETSTILRAIPDPMLTNIAVKEYEENAQHTPFDVILMDITMPVMSEKEATALIRKTDSRTPILALTGNVTMAVRGECTRLGFSSFIAKRFKSDELLEEIAKYLVSNP